MFNYGQTGVRMRERLAPKPCACSCGELTKGGQFVRGHDATMLGKIVKKYGGVIGLKHHLDHLNKLVFNEVLK